MTGRRLSWVDRSNGPSVIDLICDFCGDGVMYPNKGLGRASAAAWETRHQHTSARPPAPPLSFEERQIVRRFDEAPDAFPELCPLPDCIKPRRVGGYCAMHWARLKRTGTTDPGERPRDVSVRFYRGFREGAPGECWEWTGKRNDGGYGKAGNLYAHRLSYELHVGPIPDGMLVRHSCDNPPCCNPDHLSIGTPADNSRDMAERGRGTKRPPEERLTAEKVRDIRRRRALGEPRESVGRDYGLSPDHVTNITSRRTWGWVPCWLCDGVGEVQARLPHVLTWERIPCVECMPAVER